ncbi:ribonuclease H1 [Nephila pilipes]|uniref:Ribonuclease H n=1 Tax=Nephila pilipes TaxID=299642 RepID=A0A8X6NPQ8_NEPPI|nr:ribonuclease H1 [Nephila pilipes]
MFKVGTCAVFVLLFCLVKIAEGQKPPRAYAKAKCEKRIKNETQLEMCKICVEQYNLPEYPSKSEIESGVDFIHLGKILMHTVAITCLFKRIYCSSVLHNYTYCKNTACVRTKVKMPKPGFYAVRCGRTPGVYMTWSECEAQVKGFPNASFKKFPDRSSAETFAGISSVNQNVGQCAKNRSVGRIQSQTVTVSSTVRSYTPCDPNPSTSMSIEEAFENTSDLIFYLADKPQKPYYAVHRGATPGVYRTWSECDAQIKNTRNASYRKFDNEEQALEYVRTGGIVKATKRELNEVTYSNRVVKKLKRTNNDEDEYVLQNPNETVVVFTDGASSQNGRKRAKAGIGIYWGPNHPLNTSKRLLGRQTNNRAEIQAAVYALNQAKQIGARKVKLYTDSQFLIHAITDWIKKWKTNGWKLVNGDPVVNKEDFLELEAISKGLDVEWVYVKAHARNHGNDEADRLAVAGARLLMEPSNCSTFPKPQIESDNVEPFILTNASSSNDEILPLIIPEEDIEKKTFYAVHKGKCPGVYKTWTDCEKQIKDFMKPWFKKFSSEDEALEFVKNGKVIKKIVVPEHGPDKFVTVFTDGASSCNGQEEARAGIGVYWGPGNELNTSMRLPGRQTNNRAEIFAAVHALRQAKTLGIKNLRLYTDSQFVIKGITSWIDKWKENNWTSASGKPVINKEDFMALDNARQDINVDWCYVKGHSNNPGNVEADKLAVAGCSKSIRNLIRTCVPKKDPKEWVKGKCEDNTEKQDDIEKCFQCVDDFELPQNVTRDDVQTLRRTCLPQPSLKFKAKRKCIKRLRIKDEIESCLECIQSYKLPEKPSCEEVNEMKRKCILERAGRELWTEPILQEDDEEYLS